jgi:LuxR family maltose regulon positive regulatory protein
LIGYEDELTLVMLASVFIARNQPGKALLLLSRLEEIARSGERAGRLVEIMILKALALREMGDIPQAGIVLRECLELAEPERYLRVFLDEGQPMQSLLAWWQSHASDEPLRVYATHLLSQFSVEPHAVSEPSGRISSSGDPPASPGQALVEPLSKRELEVLQHIALGRTNQEIAEQLIVSPGTVKAHTASIYRKLDVANRTEAAARARQLGILP